MRRRVIALASRAHFARLFFMVVNRSGKMANVILIRKFIFGVHTDAKSQNKIRQVTWANKANASMSPVGWPVC